MKSQSFKLLPVAFAVACLAACGGGDAITAAVPETKPENSAPVPWASPAMILAAGETSKTIGLSNCATTGAASVPYGSATLVVNAAGDMIFSGARQGATTVSDINRINYASATNQAVEGTNQSGAPTTEIRMLNGSDLLVANTNGASFTSYIQSTNQQINCRLSDGLSAFVLNTLPSSARVAEMMTKGITGIDASGLRSGTFTSGVATWDNLQASSFGQPPAFDAPIRYLSLNVNTGAFGTSDSPTGTFANTPISLPTTPTTTVANFREFNSSNSKAFYMNIARPGGRDLRSYFERINNTLRPRAELTYTD